MADVFNGSEGEIISSKDAGALTAEFRANFPTQKKGYFFGKNKIQILASQTGTKGLRIYFGQDANGKLTLVLVAADASGNDNMNNILDTGVGCPDLCSTDNALNS